MAELEIAEELLSPAIARLELKGFLDAYTFGKFRDVLLDLIDRGHNCVVVDLTQVAYLGSAGAGVFIQAAGRIHALGGQIVLLNPPQKVKEVFDLLGLTQLFPVFQMLPDAHRYLRDHIGDSTPRGGLRRERPRS